MSVQAGAPLEARRGFLPPLKHLASDLPASLVVFLVAIPLSLGIALASGAPLMAGIIAAACGGIIAGLVAGAPLQVSGPAAGLTAIVFGFTQQLGWPAMTAAVVCAGILQILLGSVRVARVCLAVSPAVVHGMLAGIGISIVLSQLHIVLGGKPESQPLVNLRELPGQIATMHGPAAFLGLTMIAILLLWQSKLIPAKFKVIPGSLIGILIVTVVSIVMKLDVARIDLKGGLAAGIDFVRMPPSDKIGQVLIAGVTIALVASVESLLCAVATDRLHSGPRADLDRELIGQGMANTVSGVLGGLPVTGVIVRSSANVRAGAKTQTSAILHGVWVLVAAGLLAGVIQKVPLAALAGLLVFVGIQLVNVHHIKTTLNHREALVYFVTVAGVVCLNLLEGVAIGIGLAVFLLLRRLAATRITVEQAAGDSSRWHVRIDGSLTFVSVPKLTAALARVPARTSVDVDLMVDFLDQAAFEALHDWRLGHERAGGKVDIDEVHEVWYANAAQGAPRHEKAGAGGALMSLLSRRRDRVRATIDRFAVAKAHAGAQGNGHDAAAIPADGDVGPIGADELAGDGDGTPERLLDGVRQYQRRGAAMMRPMLQQLARDGRKPTELFITCSDSGVEPSLFTSSGPGDLFKVRNIGNLVPPCRHHGDAPASLSGAEDAGVASAIEYAVHVLGIRSIVVCGHSGCGAMKALLEPSEIEAMPHVREWLRFGRPTVDRFNAAPAADTSRPLVDQLAQANVVQQLEHLRTHTFVRDREAAGRLRLLGMFFDLETATVLVYDPATGRFDPVGDAAAAELVTA